MPATTKRTKAGAKGTARKAPAKAARDRAATATKQAPGRKTTARAPKAAAPKKTARAQAPEAARPAARAKASPRPKAAPRARAAARPAPRPSAAPVLPVHSVARAVPLPSAPPPRDRSAVPHGGIREVDWNGFAGIARELAAKIGARFRPDLVIGLAKGGVFVGEELARALARPFVAVQLGRRSRDGGRHLGGGMPDDLLDRRVLIVDDVAGTGEALEAATERALAAGAREVRTAAVIARPGRYRPDFAVEETADVLVLPWDYEPPTGAVGNPAGGRD